MGRPEDGEGSNTLDASPGGRCEMSHPPTPTPLSKGCAKGVTAAAKPRGLGGGAAGDQGLENKLLERPRGSSRSFSKEASELEQGLGPESPPPAGLPRGGPQCSLPGGVQGRGGGWAMREEEGAICQEHDQSSHQPPACYVRHVFHVSHAAGQPQPP